MDGVPEASQISIILAGLENVWKGSGFEIVVEGRFRLGDQFNATRCNALESR